MVSTKLEGALLIAAIATGVVGRPGSRASPANKASPEEFLHSRNLPDGYYVPSYYPAPYGGWIGEWQESYRKAREFVASMTLAEKTNLTAGTGIFMGKLYLMYCPRKNIPSPLNV